MVVTHSRTIGITIALAVLVAVILAVLPGSDTEAVGKEPRFVYHDITWTVVAGETERARVACDDGYVVDGMQWRVTGNDTAPPGLKVVTRVSRDQQKAVFIASYGAQFFDIWTEVSLKGTVVCLVGQDLG